MKRIRTSKVLAEYGQWAVTRYGIECLTSYYPIERERVHDHMWEAHMRGKNWVHVPDFLAALADARKRWPAKNY